MLIPSHLDADAGLVHRAKRIALSMLTTRVASSVLRRLTRGRCIVFTLHRFEDPAHGIAGHPEQILRSQLELLRRERCLVLGLMELIEGLRDGSLRERSAIAFTVDDGYGDFARVGSRIFAAFDCPVTVFPPTAFIDGAEWLWWDRIEAAILSTDRRALAIEINDAALKYELGSVSDRMRISLDLTTRLKRVPNAVRLSVIEQILAACGSSLAAAPPLRYAPMSWHDVRRLGASGVTFGPHTVTHPILPMTGDEQAAFELETSWRRVKESTPNAIPIFSYPNGDYSSREQSILARMNLAAAVCSEPRYLDVKESAAEYRFAVPRFPHYDDQPHFVKIINGLEGAVVNVRRLFRTSRVSAAWS